MSRRNLARASVSAVLLAVVPACDRSTPQPADLGPLRAPATAAAPRPAPRAVATVASPKERPKPGVLPAFSPPNRLGDPALVLRAPSEAPVERIRDLAAVSADDPARGGPEATVTAIIFGDVQCPYTSKAVAALEAVQVRVGPARLRLVWKNYPLEFHRRARPAAEAAAAVQLLAGPEAAFRVLDDALAGALGDAALEASALTAGAPAETYRFVLADSRDTIGAKVDADRALAESLGVRAVPEVFIGDRVIRGAASEAEYARAVEDLFARRPAPRTGAAD